MAGDLIRWFKDINKKHVQRVGKKCVSLAELARAGIQVPPGFALTIKANERMMRETSLGEKIRQYLGRFEKRSLKNYSDSEKAGNHIIQMMKGIKLPEDIRSELLKSYEKLCEVSGIPNVPVSVRSSGPVSHPGLFDTYLNVQGKAELEQKVVACWSSVFAPRAIANRAQQGRSIEKEYIGVVILQMVNARSAGVLFSVNPITGNLNEIVVEGSWGLGESVVQASVAPDRFTIDKRTLEVKEKVINEKLREVILTSQGTVVEPVSLERQAISCLNDDEIRELVRLAKIVEIHYGGIPQDVEWAISTDYPFPENVFFLQTRSVVGVKWESKYLDKPAGKSPADHIADLMIERLIG
jgi:pyruvate,water dikinase